MRGAAGVALRRGEGGRGRAAREAVARLAAGFWTRGEAVRVVLAGVVGVWVGSEAPVDEGCGCVDVDFAGFVATRSHGAFFGLGADVADWSGQERVDEFGVVLVHDFAVDEGGVFGLLDEGGFHEAELEGEHGAEEDG